MLENPSLKERETVVIEAANLVDETNRILGKDSERNDKLMDICMMLHENVSKFDWVGFYFVESDSTPELVLG